MYFMFFPFNKYSVEDYLFIETNRTRVWAMLLWSDVSLRSLLGGWLGPTSGAGHTDLYQLIQEVLGTL